ncbi:MAG TPA: hypothetical protein PKB15_04315 [Acidimicrobiia bacterium]|nr:hypothetical protein [Acidimicrobiia bacterium]
MKNKYLVVIACMVIAGFIVLGTLAQTLYERGIVADETGTSGYATNLEIALVITGLLLITIAPFIVWVFAVRQNNKART